MEHQLTAPLAGASGLESDDATRTQYAALCYRVVKDRAEVLMITSRDTGRWVIPKGWPIEGLSPHKSAAQEAWEEAGVEGKVYDRMLGIYSYLKRMDKGDDVPCVVAVYPIKVKTLHDKFLERAERKRRWMSLKKAAQSVHEPELAEILRHFNPHRLKG
ncbi:MAG: NUDIX hydrolase [Paracoccaceae bacterium]